MDSHDPKSKFSQRSEGIGFQLSIQREDLDDSEITNIKYSMHVLAAKPQHNGYFSCNFSNFKRLHFGVTDVIMSRMDININIFVNVEGMISCIK